VALLWSATESTLPRYATVCMFGMVLQKFKRLPYIFRMVLQTFKR